MPNTPDPEHSLITALSRQREKPAPYAAYEIIIRRFLGADEFVHLALEGNGWTWVDPLVLPSRQSLARIANKWTAMIIILLQERPLRFSELHREVDGITKKVLSDTLRALGRDGMIDHGVHSDRLARYELTELGLTLHDPLKALQVWAESHMQDVLDAQDRFDTASDDLAAVMTRP